MQTMGTWCRKLASSLALAALVLALPACSSGSKGGGGGGGPTGSFMSGDVASAADLVRMLQGAVAGSNVTVNVVIGGPTTSSDYYAFAFDIVIGDTAIAEYVNGSATAGGMLQGNVNPPLVSQSGNRVIVGISKNGNVAGNQGPAPESTVVSLTFRVKQVGNTTLTFDGSPSGNPGGANCSPNGPEAIDSTGTDCIPSTTFGTGGTISGS